MKKVFVKENSFIAKMGAKFLKTNNVALTIGNTIYLHNATKKDLLNNKVWLSHELVHVKQYEKWGKVKFLFLYLIECLRKGYYNCKFEVEAREKENDFKILEDYKME
jgi:hypothetical protein